jgi:hypothetical protein
MKKMISLNELDYIKKDLNKHDAFVSEFSLVEIKPLRF